MGRVKELKQNIHLMSVNSSLLYLEASSNYTIIHYRNGEREVSSYNLQVFEKMLEDLPSFKRIHRSYIVNMKHVTNVKSDESAVSLINGTNLRISRRSRVLLK
ncbi:LytR/AlgR family response regulator transcription factor [Jiulongibacter sediminis]|uniref:LytR/AlgR family response regulator transcription factor n=1 Tax=Jiulongibacter sediminis TaxID=1605367 RepID=UPI0009E7AB4F